MCNHPLRGSSTPFAAPLFSWSYELLFPQALYFEKDLRCYGCVPSIIRTQRPVLRFFLLRLFVLNNLRTLFSLFGLSSHTRTFVFSGLQTLLQKHRGYGGSAWTRPQRWPRGERSRAHAESRAERRRDIAQGIAAARATSFVAKCAGGIRAQPVPARFALRIDALHGEARQKLHIVFPQWPRGLCGSGPKARPDQVPSSPDGQMLAPILAQADSAVKRKDHNILWCPCGRPLAYSMPTTARKIKRRRT